MNVLVLQVFVSLMLVTTMVVAFIWSVRNRESEHADRLALAPLQDELSQRPPEEHHP
ncbi:MAG: cbb3-type cytochrome oxidase assembly protein CcoS [Myxococcaceae bacterium]